MREPSMLNTLKDMGLTLTVGLLMGTYWLWSPVLKAGIVVHNWVKKHRGVEG